MGPFKPRYATLSIPPQGSNLKHTPQSKSIQSKRKSREQSGYEIYNVKLTVAV